VFKCWKRDVFSLDANSALYIALIMSVHTRGMLFDMDGTLLGVYDSRQR
jgi:hypothetical protein